MKADEILKHKEGAENIVGMLLYLLPVPSRRGTVLVARSQAEPSGMSSLPIQ